MLTYLADAFYFIFGEHKWIGGLLIGLTLVLQTVFICIVGCNVVDWNWFLAFTPTIFLVGSAVSDYMSSFASGIFECEEDGFGESFLIILNKLFYVVLPILMAILYEVGVV